VTRVQVELELLKIGQIIKRLVGEYAPNANHVCVDVINGCICVNACEWDGEKSDYIEKDILRASLFPSGEVFINGKYVKGADADKLMEDE
jgi:hypothetical protein